MGKVQYSTVHISRTYLQIFLKLMQSISMEQGSRIRILSKSFYPWSATYWTVLLWGLYMGKQETGTYSKVGF